MLKQLLTGGLAASALAVPLSAVAWADPSPVPNPPTMPNAGGQNPPGANPSAAPAAGGQGSTNPAAPAVPGSNVQSAACVASANSPAQGPPGTMWVQVATLDSSAASQLGLPPGQTMNVFCAPVGSRNVAERPTAPANQGQTNPPQNPPQNQPGQTGPQNAVAAQH